MNFQLGGKPISLLQPMLVGILNLTPDSFSDGGSYTTLDTALKHTRADA